MKQRVGQLLLGALVIAVWSAVIFRALKKPNELDVALPIAPIESHSQVGIPKEKVPHLELTRDPFLDGIAVVPQRSNSVLPKNTRSATQANRPDHKAGPVRSSPWPTVAYTGSMGNAKDPANRLAFLTINGKDHMLRAGATVNDMVLQEVLSDSVIFARDGYRKAWARQ